MTTDIRTNGPTEAQVEAAAKALHETQNLWFDARGDWGAAGFEIKQAFRVSARAALVAAQGAAPVPSSGVDEDALARVIDKARNRWAIYGRKDELLEPYLARAVIASRTEWLKGQGR